MGSTLPMIFLTPSLRRFELLGVDSNPSVSVTMLVPAAPRPSRLSATPSVFFLQIGHCINLGHVTTFLLLGPLHHLTIQWVREIMTSLDSKLLVAGWYLPVGTGRHVLVTEFQGMVLNGLFCADVLRPLDLVPLTDFTYKYHPD